MKPIDPSQKLRAQYLESCQELLESVQNMRNYAMKPGNIWLAKSELSKISGTLSEIEALLESIKQLDSAN